MPHVAWYGKEPFVEDIDRRTEHTQHIFHAATSYGPPIIYEILHEDGQPFTSGKTTGADKLFIRGQNFGIHNARKIPLVSYGEGLDEKLKLQNRSISENNFIGISCAISNPHTEITCLTEKGADLHTCFN